MCPGVGPAACRILRGFALNRRGIRQQHDRIKVALQRDGMANATSSGRDIHRPVESYCSGANSGNFRKPRAATLGEHDGRYGISVRCRVKSGKYIAHRRQGQAAVRVGGQHTAPCIEDHHRVNACSDLFIEIGGDRPRIGRDETPQKVRSRMGHLPHRREIGASAAFDHVAGQA